MNIACLCSELYDLSNLYLLRKKNKRKVESYRNYVSITKKKFKVAGIDELLLEEIEHRILLIESNSRLLSIDFGPKVRRSMRADTERLQRSIDTLRACCDKLLLDRYNNHQS